VVSGPSRVQASARSAELASRTGRIGEAQRQIDRLNLRASRLQQELDEALARSEAAIREAKARQAQAEHDAGAALARVDADAEARRIEWERQHEARVAARQGELRELEQRKHVVQDFLRGARRDLQ
jgi:hypothetical protein